MRLNDKRKLFNMGEFTFVTLSQLDKEELLEHISMLNNNIEAHKERENVIRARLKKCYEYFKKQGLTEQEIEKIISLEGEIRGW